MKTLVKILSCPNVCSKEWIIRQYDHEVQGGSVIKPLLGIHNDGPSDAAVILPLDSPHLTTHPLTTHHSPLSTRPRLWHQPALQRSRSLLDGSRRY